MSEMRANCTMHSRSHREPKKSIYGEGEKGRTAGRAPEKAHLWLQQTAFEQHKRLPLELVDELSQAHAEILIFIALQAAPCVLFGQTLLKSTKDLGIGKVPLCKPGLRHYA